MGSFRRVRLRAAAFVSPAPAQQHEAEHRGQRQEYDDSHHHQQFRKTDGHNALLDRRRPDLFHGPLYPLGHGGFRPRRPEGETIVPGGSLTGLDDFSALVEEQQAMVFRLLARLTGEREELEDMAQEVFLRLFRALPHFERRAKLATYVYRIVVNVVNDEFRRRAGARRTHSIDQEACELPNPAPGPADLLEQSRFHEALDAALGRMKFEDRTILALHYQEGRSYEEIAAILKEPMGTVKTHLFRARERLKAQLAEWISRCKSTH